MAKTKRVVTVLRGYRVLQNLERRGKMVRNYFQVSMSREYIKCPNDYYGAADELRAMPEVKSIDTIECTDSTSGAARAARIR